MDVNEHTETKRPFGARPRLIALGALLVLLVVGVVIGTRLWADRQARNEASAKRAEAIATYEDWVQLDEPASEIEQALASGLASESVLDFVEDGQDPAVELDRAAHQMTDPPAMLRRAKTLALRISEQIQDLEVLHERYREVGVDATFQELFGPTARSRATQQRSDEILEERDATLFELRADIPQLREELDRALSELRSTLDETAEVLGIEPGLPSDEEIQGATDP